MQQQQQQQQLVVQCLGYYCHHTNSPSIKIHITYPSNIANLTYNFELTLTVSIQKMFPKISYQKVHTQTIYTPRRQIVLNNLLQRTMYQLRLRFSKFGSSKREESKVLDQQKVVSVFTQRVPQRDQQQQQQIYYGQGQGQYQQHRQQQSYSKLVRENIRDYFNEYHNNSNNSRQQNNNNNNNININNNSNNININNNNNNNRQLPSASSKSIRSNNQQQPSSISSSSKLSNNNTRVQYSNHNNSNSNKSNTHISNNNNTHKSSSTYKPSTTNTKPILCNSQTLIKVIGQTQPLINNKKLQKYILQARKSSSTKQYLSTKDYLCFNNMNKLYNNQHKRRQHIEKTLLLTKAVNMFGQIYRNDLQSGVIDLKSHQRTGKEFFKNDWFMGPFYSYDGNQKLMKKKNNNNSNMQQRR